MPKETPNHHIRYPETGDPNTLVACHQHIAEDVERELDAIAPKQITGVAKKQLLIASSSGVVTPVTAGGDVTNDESGVFSIGKEKVTLEKLAKALALPGSYLADGAVTSQKFKPLCGVISSTEPFSLGTSFTSLVEGKGEFTPVVPSTLKVTAVFDLEARVTSAEAEAGHAAEAIGTIRLDSEAEKSPHAMVVSSPTSPGSAGEAGNIRATVIQVYALSLTAATHKIEMRAKKGTNGLAECYGGRLLYELVAS